MTERQAGPQGLATPQEAAATSGDVARKRNGRGLVSVELTDIERSMFGRWVFENGRGLLLEGAIDERDIMALVRFDMMFRAARSRQALHLSLMRGAWGHGERTTTVKLHRAQATWFGRLLVQQVVDADEGASLPPADFWKMSTGARLLAAAQTRPGKRPKRADREIAKVFEQFERRRGVSALQRTAIKFGVAPSTALRAVRRWRKAGTGLARALLSE